MNSDDWEFKWIIKIFIYYKIKKMIITVHIIIYNIESWKINNHDCEKERERKKKKIEKTTITI